MLRLLFDLDETLYTGDLIKEASYLLIKEGVDLDKVYSGRDISDFKTMDGVPEIVKNKCHTLFKDPHYGALNKKPLPGALPFLKILHSYANTLGILTIRPKELYGATRYALQRDFPTIDFTIMFATGSSKKSKIKEFNPDVYFDDNIDFCREAESVSRNIEVYLISNNHTAWNTKFRTDVISTGQTRIKTVKSILDYDLKEMIRNES